MEFFVDGRSQGTRAFIGTLRQEASVTIGGSTNPTLYHFNGTVDEVAIFNSSLSLEQIILLNATNGTTFDNIVRQETKHFENWSACVTPNDGTVDGTTVCSTSQNVTITNTAPNLTREDINSTDPAKNTTNE